MKKIFSKMLMLTVAVVFLLGMTSPVYAVVLNKDSAKMITAGESKAVVENVVISESEGRLLYAITASVSGVYEICTESEAGADTMGYILSQDNLDTENCLLKNDDYGKGRNCGFIINIEKGQTVYFAVGYFNDSSLNKSFNVIVERKTDYYGEKGVIYEKYAISSGSEAACEYRVFGNYLTAPAEVEILSEIDGIPVGEISANAFSGCEYIASVKIPGSVRIIRPEAFKTARNLKSVTLSEGIEIIKNEVFAETALKAVHIPASVSSIGSDVFGKCYRIQSLTVNEGNLSYRAEDNVLYSKDMKTLIYAPSAKRGTFVVPKGVETIGEKAFKYSNLEEILLPDSVISIESEGFRGSKIQRIKLNKGLKSIGEQAFYYCRKLTSITFPSTLVQINQDAFGDSGLLYVEIPESVESIGAYAFSQCSIRGIVINGSGDATSIASYSIINSDAVMYGHTGSTAETYAKKYGMTFVPLDRGTEGCTHPNGFVLYEYQTPPTCTATGVGRTKCPVCGLAGNNLTIEKTEHNNPSGICLDCGRVESNVTSIEVNESRTYTVESTEENKTVAFTAKKAGTYTIAISEIKDILVCYVVSETAENQDNCILGTRKVTEELREGERLYIVAASNIPTASFKVTVTCCHEKKTEKMEKASFRTEGKKQTVCAACGKIYSTTVIPKVSSVSLSDANYIYDGKTKTPSVTVKDRTGKELTKDKDYTITYSIGRKEIGTYKVTVTLKGNYSGSKTLSYTIVPGKVTGLKQWTSEYSTSRIKMSWAKVAGAEGYAMYRATEKDGTYKLVKTVTATSCTNEGLKAGSKFYYRIRAYKTVGGKKVYGAYSDAKCMVTKPAAPAVTLTEGSKSAKITWTKSTSANGYEVYMSTSKTGTYTKIKTANASTLSYIKTGLKSGQKYYIKVRAYTTLAGGSKVYSGYSQPKAVTAK